MLTNLTITTFNYNNINDKGFIEKVYKEVVKKGPPVTPVKLYLFPHTTLFVFDDWNIYKNQEKNNKCLGFAHYNDGSFPYIGVRSVRNLIKSFNISEEEAKRQYLNTIYHELKHLADYYILGNMNHPLKEFCASLYAHDYGDLFKDYMRDIENLRIKQQVILESLKDVNEGLVNYLKSFPPLTSERAAKMYEAIIGDDLQKLYEGENVDEILRKHEVFSYVVPVVARYIQDYLRETQPDLIKVALPFIYSRDLFRELEKIRKHF